MRSATGAISKSVRKATVARDASLELGMQKRRCLRDLVAMSSGKSTFWELQKPGVEPTN